MVRWVCLVRPSWLRTPMSPLGLNNSILHPVCRLLTYPVSSVLYFSSDEFPCLTMGLTSQVLDRVGEWSTNSNLFNKSKGGVKEWTLIVVSTDPPKSLTYISFINPFRTVYNARNINDVVVVVGIHVSPKNPVLLFLTCKGFVLQNSLVCPSLSKVHFCLTIISSITFLCGQSFPSDLINLWLLRTSTDLVLLLHSVHSVFPLTFRPSVLGRFWYGSLDVTSVVPKSFVSGKLVPHIHRWTVGQVEENHSSGCVDKGTPQRRRGNLQKHWI